MKNYGKFVVGVVLAWFIFALTASARGVFNNGANRFGFAVAFAALIPIILFFLWFAAAPRFRQFALSLDPRILTFAQAWRVVGATFVVLQVYRILPAIFALPAGYGDIAIGATAPFVAWKLVDPGHRGSFILWQFLGISDLIIAVSLGITAGLRVVQDAPITAMTVLPLSLIPTFFVPLFTILHAICIAQAKAWKNASLNTVQAKRLVNEPMATGF
jgi:hypothetical protein